MDRTGDHTRDVDEDQERTDREREDRKLAARQRRDEDADFASEHTSPTFADDMPGGPEGRQEPESPSGEAGDGGMDPGEQTSKDV